jgi:hypothetical protein
MNDPSLIQKFLNSPKEAVAQVARGHGSNWFKASDPWEVQRSLQFAQVSLLMRLFL